MKKRLVCLVFALVMLGGCANVSASTSRVTGFVDRVEDNDVAIVEIVLPDGSFYYVDVVSDLLSKPLKEGQVLGLYRTGKAYWFSNGTKDRSDDFRILDIGPDGTYASWHMVIDHCAWFEDRGVVYVERVNDDFSVLEIIADDGYVYMVRAFNDLFPDPFEPGDKFVTIKYDGSYWFTCGTVELDDDIELLGCGEDGTYATWPDAFDWAPAWWFADFLATRH